MSKIGQDGNANDRKLGEDWEDEAVRFIESLGGNASLYQRKHGSAVIINSQKFICPDIKVQNKEGLLFYVEVKHKYPSLNGMFGLEEYRVNSFLEFQKAIGCQVLYLIHDYSGKQKYLKTHTPDQWKAQWLDKLEEYHIPGKSDTYHSGGVIEDVPIHYYPVFLFEPLSNFIAPTPEVFDNGFNQIQKAQLQDELEYYKKNNQLLWKIVAGRIQLSDFK